mgnify:CR=1 FL=1
MLYTQAAAALLGAFIAAVGAWQVQSWRYTGQITQIKAEQLEAVNAATREARATESRRFTNVQEAQNAAQKRAQTARLDADRARTELDRLRDELASTRGGVPGESTAACAVRAAAGADVLAQCAAAYLSMAGIADRHANDARTLIEAWPK